MKTGLLHYLAAYNFWLCSCGCGLVVLVILLWSIPPGLTTLSDAGNVFAFLLAYPFCIALGWLFGALLLFPFVARLAARVNGAPFHIGETVHILSGPNRGRDVRIYELWEERGQVRVELGETERRECKDVFAYFEVCRPG